MPEKGFEERAIWFCLYPKILEKLQRILKLRESPLKEALLLSTVIYYVRMNMMKSNRDYWNCSMKKLREQFLPFFSEATLWRSTQRVQQTGILSAFTNNQKTVWRVDFKSLENLLNESFPTSEKKAFQSERTQSKVAEFKKTEPRRISKIPNLQNQETEKKEATALINTSLLTEELPDNEKGAFHTESPSFHTERHALQTESQQPEKKSAKIQDWEMDFLDSHLIVHLPEEKKESDDSFLDEYLNAKAESFPDSDEESFQSETLSKKESSIVSELQQEFNGTLTEHEPSNGIFLTSSVQENGNRLLKLLGREPLKEVPQSQFRCNRCNHDFSMQSTLNRHYDRVHLAAQKVKA